MASTPRANLADDVILGIHCAICGADALDVVHVDRLPDYVECGQCKSAFVMEDGGERVFYGQIAEGYLQTAQFALRQWAWLEAVDARAQEERPDREGVLESETASFEDMSDQPSSLDDTVSSVGLDEFADREPPMEVEDAGLYEASVEGEADEPPALQEDDALPGWEEVPSSEEPSAELHDQEAMLEQVEGGIHQVDRETEPWETFESDATLDEDREVGETEHEAGFDWLGGLADEEEPIRDPDFSVSAPDSAAEEVPAAAQTEGGLSADDLDDLFQADEQEMFETPAVSVGAEGQPEAKDTLEQDWDWARQGAEDSMDEEEEDDAPVPEGWLSRDEDESEPALTDFGAPDESLTSEDVGEPDDFLSSLRDSAAVPLESQPLQDPSLDDGIEADEPPPPSWAVEDGEEEVGVMAARMQSVTAAEREQAEQSQDIEEQPEIENDIPEPEQDVIRYSETDPPPGFRHRVVIGGDRVVFPGGECVHCGRTPVKGQLAIEGTLPEGQGMGDRKPTRFQVPLCGECRDRATQLSEDARTARTQSFLIAGIIGMALVVASLAFKVVDPGDLQVADGLLLLIMFVIGFAGSALLLLSRASNYPPPLDAAYIRTTLLIPSESQGLETAFEWRNAEYAHRFLEANEANTLGSVTRVKDRLTLGEP